MSASGDMVKVYHNIFFHNKKWLGLVSSNGSQSQDMEGSYSSSSSSTTSRQNEKSSSSRKHSKASEDSSNSSTGCDDGLSSKTGGTGHLDRGMSINTEVVLLPTSNVAAFIKNLKVNAAKDSICMTGANQYRDATWRTALDTWLEHAIPKTFKYHYVCEAPHYLLTFMPRATSTLVKKAHQHVFQRYHVPVSRHGFRLL
jgi:hypothetical protein